MVPAGPLATRTARTSTAPHVAAAVRSRPVSHRTVAESASDTTAPASRRQAGASAAAMYEQQRRLWLRRNRRAFRRINAVCGVLGVAALITYVSLPGTGWFAGLLAGLVLGLGIAVRLNPPAWIAQWQAGAVGEQRTGRELASLPGDWLVRHDIVRSDRGNIDHLVVGPAGVFVLDTKNVNTEVRVEDGTLVALRPDGVVRYRTRKPARQVRLTAVELNRALGRTGNGFWVHSVVVVWGDMPQRVVEDGGVTWVRGDALAEWLQALPPEPYERRLSRVVDRLDDALAQL